MLDDISKYEDGWYEYYYCKMSKGKKKHALISYIGEKITDPANITDLENRIKEKALVS